MGGGEEPQDAAEGEIRPHPEAVYSPHAPALEINGLTFAYEGSPSPVLRDVNLTIRRGEFVLLAGPSGCGKTTLARCITGFIPHEFPGSLQGTVRLFGANTQELPIHQIARLASLVQQDPDGQLCTLNVTDEVAFGPENFLVPPPQIARRIEWALRATESLHLANRSTLTLSGGEKQRVVLSSLLAVKAPLLVLDEPAAHLDPQATHHVAKTLLHLHRQQEFTILLIAHRLSPFIPHATRLLLMRNGRLVFDGSPSRLSSGREQLWELGLQLPPPSNIHKMKEGIEPAPAPLLVVRRLTFTYPESDDWAEEERGPSARSPALQDVSFTLHPGEVAAVMGPNGSGKTTLLRLLMGLIQPVSGEILLAGRLLRGLAVSQLAREVGFLFQNPLHQLFERTVWEELLLASRHLRTPDPEEATARATELADWCGLTPHLGRSPFALSVGEQRRLTLASLLIHRPRLLLLDEPLLGQDYLNVHRLMELIMRAVREGASALLVTHDSSVAQAYCHRLLFLREGRLLVNAPIPQAFNQLQRLGETTYLPPSPSSYPPLNQPILPNHHPGGQKEGWKG